MRYVIMANGKGTRWGNHGGIPKHLISIDGETLLERTVRLIKAIDSEAEVFISSRNERYEVDGATRHEPLRSDLEIDRFTYELIQDNICFLYGDTYYTKEAMTRIIAERMDSPMKFFGNTRSIIGVKSSDAELMTSLIDRIRDMHLAGELPTCKGWQLYQAYAELPFGGPCFGKDYVLIEDETGDFNYPIDLDRFETERRTNA